jgi:hypothetical protein
MSEHVIWKYDIPIVDEFTLDLPEGSSVLTFQMQRGNPCIWIVFPDNGEPLVLEKRTFCVIGTGNKFDDNKDSGGMFYIGTIQEAGFLVWHLWEKYDNPGEDNA